MLIIFLLIIIISNIYIRQIRIAKVRILGTHFWCFFDAFLSLFGSSIFDPQNCQFLMGIWHPKLIPKTAQKRVRNRDPENAIQPVICVPENGVCPVRGSQKWLKNDPKKEHFLDINNADLADVIIVGKNQGEIKTHKKHKYVALHKYCHKLK